MDKIIIERLLPQFNCGACGYRRCSSFATALIEQIVTIDNCPVLGQERFKTNRTNLEEYLQLNGSNDSNNNPALLFDKHNQPDNGHKPKEDITNTDAFKESHKFTGLIDHADADFILNPLRGEPSCRETLVNFTPIPLSKNMVIRYRPLGCPITHFAKILEINHGLMDIWVTGPPLLITDKPDASVNNQQRKLQKNSIHLVKHAFTPESQEKIKDLGICMVLSFQGTVEPKDKNELPQVGQTVQFLPAHCMMGKVHSGVIVSMEGNSCRIDCIDLKVQTPRKV
jgi:uncharacterized Fe-S cluster-containing protein